MTGCGCRNLCPLHSLLQKKNSSDCRQRYMYKRHVGFNHMAGPGSTPRSTSDRTRLQTQRAGQRAAKLLRPGARTAPGAEDHGEMRSRFDEERCSELVVLAKGKSWRGLSKKEIDTRNACAYQTCSLRRKERTRWSSATIKCGRGLQGHVK
jgi:hypothetical protein